MPGPIIIGLIAGLMAYSQTPGGEQRIQKGVDHAQKVVTGK